MERTCWPDGSPVTAVVPGAEHPTGLGSARALRRVGVRVWGITSNPDAPCSRSRAWNRLVSFAGGAEACLERVLELGSELDRPAFLLPTQDRFVELLSRERERFVDAFRFRLPDPETVELLLDKTRFYRWAADRGIPVPPSRIVRNPAELEDAVREIGPPVIVKPPYRTHAWTRWSPLEKVLRIRTLDDLRAAPRELLESSPSFVVSRWIQGPDHAVHFCLACCDARGEMLASFTGRKLLQYPRQMGSTAICAGSDRDDVRELTARVFRDVGMEGIGSLEVKADRDGRIFITEPTVGRPNLQSYAAVAAGRNLHAVALRDALDLGPLPGVDAPARPRIWVEENALIALASGRNDRPVPLRPLLEAARHNPLPSAAYTSLTDPGPSTALALKTMGRAVRKVGRWVGIGRKADALGWGPAAGPALPPSPTPEPVPALVLGDGVTALGVTRCLGRAGIPAFNAAVGPDRIVLASRWARAAPGRLPGASRIAPYLEGLPLEGAVLIPCSDELSLAVSRLPDRLARRFPSYVADPEVQETLVDKGRFLHALRRLDIPHPLTELVDGPADLPALDDEEAARYFIKPRESQSFFRRFRVKAFRPSDPETFRSRVDALLSEGIPIMVQEYVPGPMDHHYFVDGFAAEGGEVVATLVRRRLRMHPPDFGNSSFMITVPRAEAAPAIGSLRTLLDDLNFRGIFSAEFKRDARDGAFRILEINARPWWYVEFAARAGIDVVGMTYRAALEGDPGAAAPDYTVGMRFVYPSYDVSACNRLHGRTGALWRMAVDWPGALQPVLALDDPLPILRSLRRSVPGAVGRRLRRLTGRRAQEGDSPWPGGGPR